MVTKCSSKGGAACEVWSGVCLLVANLCVGCKEKDMMSCVVQGAVFGLYPALSGSGSGCDRGSPGLPH